MSRTNSEYKPPPRPPSEQLSDVHVYIVPTDIWRKRYNNLLNSSVTETISLGIIRIHPDVKVYLLRDELEQQIGTQLLPREYVFLKSVGRSLTRLKPKQEYQLKAKTFLPPNAYASEIYLLESYEGQFGPGSSDASTRTHTRNSFRATDEGYSSYKDGHPSSRMFPDDSTSRNYYNLHNGHSNSRIGGYSPDSQHRSRYRDDIDSPRRKGAVVEDGVRDQERGYKSDGSPSHKNHHKDGDKRGAYGQRSDDVRKSQDRLNDSQKGDEWNDDHKRDRRRRNDSQRKDDEWSDDDTRDRRRRHDSQRKDELSDDDTQNRQRRGGGGADDDDDDYYSEGDENSHRKHKRRSERSDGEDDYSDDNDENSKSGRRRRRRHSDRKKNGNDNASERLDQSDEELNRFPSPPGVPRGALEPFEDISNINDKDKLMAILEKQRSQRKAAEKEREDLVKKVKQMQSKTQNRRNFGDIEDLQARDIWKKRYFEEKKKTPPLEDQCNKLRQELDALHRRLMTTLEGPKERHIKLNDKHPSQKNNYKLQAIKLQHEIEDMRRRVENSKMKLTAEMKLRNQAETELRALRAELTQKKINLSLTRTSQLAALTAPDKLPAIQNTKQPITPRS